MNVSVLGSSPQIYLQFLGSHNTRMGGIALIQEVHPVKGCMIGMDPAQRYRKGPCILTNPTVLESTKASTVACIQLLKTLPLH